MICTPEHPIFVQNKGWVPAGMLNSGDFVITGNGGTLAVDSISWQRDEKHGFTVYNLTIEDDHTYFVGIRDGGIWVHNVPCGDWTSPEGLVYGRDRLYGNRIFHLFHHLAEDPVRIANGQTHSIFKVDTSLEAIDLVDEAWKTRVGPGILQSNGNTQFIVPMGRDVGTVGERNITVIVRIQSGVNKFISAFPSL